jgi:hypothetical protein
MPRFLLIARDGGRWTRISENASPTEIQAVLGKYRAWMDRVAGQGKLKGGEKLRDGQGRVLTGQDKALKVTDGPYVESKEVVGGFWLIEADTYDDVVKLAAESPHLQFGTLEVREIEEMR